jgi:hypothetical protein
MSRIVILAAGVVPVMLPIMTLALGLFGVVSAAGPCPPADGC